MGAGHGGVDLDELNIEACAALPLEEYNLALHISSIFIVLIFSLLGTLIPFLAKRNKRFQLNPYLFALIKAFGMGVILSTGFVHMFPPADQALNNPCLPEGFHTYTAYSGLFALIAVLFTQAVQTAAIQHFKSPVVSPVEPIKSVDENHSMNAPINSTTDTSQIPELGSLSMASAVHREACCGTDAMMLARGHHDHRQVTAYILEFGVAIHSVIIGITLGVTRGQEFTSLLIALVFHQFFEGFALSNTALDAGFKNSIHPIIMAWIYTLTTPVGVAIGLGVAEIYNQNSTEALLTQGIMDAISAGILIYDALVNLITVDITHSATFGALPTRKKVGIFLSLWLGAAIMSMLGKWV